MNGDAPHSRAAQKQRTRRRLLEAAKLAFAERGYGATQIRDIVGRAGTAIGTFYVHFPNKRSVFRELLDEATGELVQLMGERMAGERETLGRVRAIFEQFLDYLADNWELFVLLREGRGSESEFAPALRAVFERFNQNLERILARGMDKGEIARINPRLLSRTLVAMGVEAIAMVREDGLPRAEVLESLDRLVAHGLRGA